MKALRMAVGGLLLLWGGISPSYAALSFSDGFEGPTLNSFWTASATNGSITFPSTAQVHSGSQSVQFNSTNTGNKEIVLKHNFATPIFGTASVWLFDTGADVFSSNYLQFILILPTVSATARIGTQDYDLGPGNDGSTYVITSPLGNQATVVDRTRTWHELKITSTPSELTFFIDGTLRGTVAGSFPFNAVELWMFGPSFRPAFTAYYDDFQLTELSPPNTVPEPSSLVLFGSCLAGLGISRLVSRRKSPVAS